jgi:hypothetical protein
MEPVRSGGFGREAVAGDDAVVVEPDQLDHLGDVVVGLDPARRRSGLAREDRVVDYTSLGLQLGAELRPEAEVGGAVAVQVADLVTADLEANSPRMPGPASTPGQEVTSSVIRSLAVWAWLIGPPPVGNEVRTNSIHPNMAQPYKFKCT